MHAVCAFGGRWQTVAICYCIITQNAAGGATARACSVLKRHIGVCN